MATLYIDDHRTEITDLSGFAFHIPPADETHAQPQDWALIRLDYKAGPSRIVRGPDAVTLKVLLSSAGIRDLSKDWQPLAVEGSAPPSVAVLDSKAG